MMDLFVVGEVNLLPFILALVTLGVFAGFLSGLLGIGGGTVMVPGMLFIFTALDYNGPYIMHIAIGTAFFVMIFSGLSSARAHWKRDSVDLDLVKRLGAGIFFGVLLGSYTASRISSDGLVLFFGIALFVTAVLMASNPSRFKLFDKEPGHPVSGLVGVFIGFVSTLMGIGGSVLSVPYMSMCQVPIKRAVGTSAALGLTVSIPAIVGYFVIGLGQGPKPPLTFGFINVLAWMFIVPSAILAAPYGARAAHWLPVKMLRLVFALFMMLVAAKMTFGEG